MHIDQFGFVLIFPRFSVFVGSYVLFPLNFFLQFGAKLSGCLPVIEFFVEHVDWFKKFEKTTIR